MSFSAGFSINPERLTITSVFAATNRLTLTVAWRLRKVCSPGAATEISHGLQLKMPSLLR